MPDLNLLDDVSFEEETPSAPISQKQKPKQKKQNTSDGGGAGSIILIILIVILLLGAGAYFLNKKGIIKLWGKKSTVTQIVEEEPFPPIVQDQQVQPTVPPPVQPDTTQIALLDTTNADQQIKTEEATKGEMDGVEKQVDIATMEGEYTIQVIAFKEKKRADEISENLQVAGYPAFVEKVALKKGTWYRVCIGKYPTREDAKKAVLSFGTQLRSSYIIDKVTQR
ncbi:MAG: SPOR domain-containing protein [Bacteroidetes bacterium]|nr:SPOR domain-containing protein [Bacteroidota bacterium]